MEIPIEEAKRDIRTLEAARDERFAAADREAVLFSAMKKKYGFSSNSEATYDGLITMMKRTLADMVLQEPAPAPVPTGNPYGYSIVTGRD